MEIHIVEFPSGLIIADVFADFGEIVFVSHDVFPVVSMPEFASKGLPTSFFTSSTYLFVVIVLKRCTTSGNDNPVGACPYDNYNTVNVIRHDDEFIDVIARVMVRDFIPNGLEHDSCVILLHDAIRNFTKQTSSVMSA